MSKLKNIIYFILVLLFVFILFLQFSGAEQEVLKMAFIPGGDIETEIDLFGKIIENVSQQIGYPIKILAATEYATVVEGLRGGHLQLARLGPFSYILARSLGVPLQPIVMEDLINQGISYFSILIARTDRQIKFSWKKEVVQNLTVALCSPSSTSGGLIPRAEGLVHDPQITLDLWKKVFWSGSHNASIAAVQNGNADVAFIADRRLTAAIANGIVQEDELEIIWQSGPIPNSPFVATSDLGIEMLMKIEWAFLHVPDELLIKANLNGFEPVNDSTYRYVSRIGEKYLELVAK
jgi:phosphonate transport system substrate-binding protein